MTAETTDRTLDQDLRDGCSAPASAFLNDLRPGGGSSAQAAAAETEHHRVSIAEQRPGLEVRRPRRRHTQADLIGLLGSAEVAVAFEALDPEDRAELLDELPRPSPRVWSAISPQERELTRGGARLPAWILGRRMSPEFIHATDDDAASGPDRGAGPRAPGDPPSHHRPGPRPVSTPGRRGESARPATGRTVGDCRRVGKDPIYARTPTTTPRPPPGVAWTAGIWRCRSSTGGPARRRADDAIEIADAARRGRGRAEARGCRWSPICTRRSSRSPACVSCGCSCSLSRRSPPSTCFEISRGHSEQKSRAGLFILLTGIGGNTVRRPRRR